MSSSLDAKIKWKTKDKDVWTFQEATNKWIVKDINNINKKWRAFLKNLEKGQVNYSIKVTC